MEKSDKKIPIYEMFKAFQGEGGHMGKAFFFIRTFGCPVKCNFCDSAGTWHPDYVPKDIQRFSATELCDMVLDSKIPRVIITGGEPTVHDLTSLTLQLKKEGIASHLETSGAFPIQGDFSWITLSPKWAKLPLPENLHRADEFKIIVVSPNDIEAWAAEISSILAVTPLVSSREPKFWLHPEWSQRNNPEVLKAISEAVLAHPERYRAGYQIHRLYAVDSLDLRSRPAVPLGGRSENDI